MTAIEWTHRGETKGETWNPVTGCDRCSPGCDNCYALTLAKRLKGMGQPKYQNDGDPLTSGPGFGVTCHPAELGRPLRWRKPRTVFVNSMSDLFHADVPLDFILEVWSTMAKTPQHTYQVLTKRPQRMQKVVGSIAWDDDDTEPSKLTKAYAYPGGWWNDNDEYFEIEESDLDGGGEMPLENVWLGTSIESDRYSFRADHLRATSAAVRFLSLEPLLGPLPSLDLTGIDWVIVGGESGKGARPMHPDWVRDIRDRCVEAGVAFFFKQWGEWVAPEFIDTAGWDDVRMNENGSTVGMDGGVWHNGAYAGDTDRYGVWKVGKKKAGRVLDGRTWDEYPEPAA